MTGYPHDSLPVGYIPIKQTVAISDIEDRLGVMEANEAVVRALLYDAAAAANLAIQQLLQYANITLVPNGADQTLALRTVFETGGTFPAGDFFYSKVDNRTYAFTTTGKSRVTIKGNDTRFIQTWNPLDPDGTLVGIWQGISNADLRASGITFDMSPPPIFIGDVTSIAGDRSTLTVRPQPGEPIPQFRSTDCFGWGKKTTKGNSWRGWNRSKDPEGSPRPFPLNDNGDGTFTLAPYPTSALVTAITSLNPLIITVTNQTAYGAISGDLILMTWTGVSQLNGKVLIAKAAGTIDDPDADGGMGAGLTSVRLKDPDTGSSINATGYGLSVGAVSGPSFTNVPFDASIAVGDPIYVPVRKKANGGLLMDDNARLSVDCTLASGVGLFLNGKGNGDVYLNLLAQGGSKHANSAGLVWLKDSRRLTVGSIVSQGSGDNVFNSSGTDLAKWLVTAVPNSFILKCQWFVPGVRGTLPVKPVAGDKLEHWKNDGTLAATATVLGVDPADTSTTGGVLLDTALPSDYATAVYKTVNRSRVAEVIFTGGISCNSVITTAITAQSSRIVVPYLNGRNVYSNLRRKVIPSGSAWAGQAVGNFGGDQIGRSVAEQCSFAYRAGEAAVWYYDRQGSTNAPATAAQASETNWYGEAIAEGYGYGGLAVSGQKMVIDVLDLGPLALRGQLRGSTPGIDLVAQNDVFVGPGGELIVGTLPAPLGAYYEHALALPSQFLCGSGLINLGTIAANATTILAAKKVKVGDEGRLQVRVGGVLQDPSTYTANGTTTLTFAVPPITTGAPIAYTVTHTGC